MVFLPLFSLRMVRPGSVPGATVVVCLVPAPVARLALRASLIIFLIIQQTKFKLILFIVILSFSNIITRREYLFVAIDDFSGELYAAIVPDKNQNSAKVFLE